MEGVVGKLGEVSWNEIELQASLRVWERVNDFKQKSGMSGPCTGGSKI